MNYGSQLHGSGAGVWRRLANAVDFPPAVLAVVLRLAKGAAIELQENA